MIGESGESAAAVERLGLFQLFGLTVASELDLPGALPGAGQPHDVVFRLRHDSESLPDFDSAAPTYRSPFQDFEGNVRLRAASGAHGDLIRFGERLQFEVGDGEIVCRSTPRVEVREIEILLLGAVLSYWLERREISCIHASAIVTPRGGAGFLAGNGGGKSALAASFLQAGHPLLTDDILALELREEGIFGRASYPQMRFWPAEAERFAGSAAGERVHATIPKIRVAIGEGGFGAFHPLPARMRALYLPVRGAASEAIAIEPIRPRDAVIELVRESFVAHLVAAAPWAGGRLSRLATIAEAVPLRRLRYPTGFERLPEVRDAILADLRTLAGSSAAGDPG